MQRTKYNKPDAILTADWHLRETQPVCRTDDFWATQWQKVDFVSQLQRKHKCSVLHAGDLFNHWKPSPYLLSETMVHLPDDFWTIYGQHDLPYHNYDAHIKSGLFTLSRANKLHVSNSGHWNQQPRTGATIAGKEILIWHVPAYKDVSPYFDHPANSAKTLLRKHPDYDLIVTGDNHKSFTEQYEGRLLVNPGSLMRQTADQVDHQPCVYLWYASTNTVEPVYLPIKQDVVSRQHIEQREQHNQRIEAFITQLNSEWKASVSFEENLKQIEHEIPEPVMDIIHKALDNERI